MVITIRIKWQHLVGYSNSKKYLMANVKPLSVIFFINVHSNNDLYPKNHKTTENLKSIKIDIDQKPLHVVLLKY